MEANESEIDSHSCLLHRIVLLCVNCAFLFNLKIPLNIHIWKHTSYGFVGLRTVEEAENTYSQILTSSLNQTCDGPLENRSRLSSLRRTNALEGYQFSKRPGRRRTSFSRRCRSSSLSGVIGRGRNNLIIRRCSRPQSHLANAWHETHCRCYLRICLRFVFIWLLVFLLWFAPSSSGFQAQQQQWWKQAQSAQPEPCRRRARAVKAGE